MSIIKTKNPLKRYRNLEEFLEMAERKYKNSPPKEIDPVTLKSRVMDWEEVKEIEIKKYERRSKDRPKNKDDRQKSN